MVTQGTAGSRAFIRDLKPYAVVESLDELRGPDGGLIELPHAVRWAPSQGPIDLDQPGGTALAYQAVSVEGTVADLATVLNRERLMAMWPTLMLPQRLSQFWESRFPELNQLIVE